MLAAELEPLTERRASRRALLRVMLATGTDFKASHDHIFPRLFVRVPRVIGQTQLIHTYVITNKDPNQLITIMLWIRLAAYNYSLFNKQFMIYVRGSPGEALPRK